MIIHDALWVEAPHEEEAAARNLVRKIMTTALKLTGPLVLDFMS